MNCEYCKENRMDVKDYSWNTIPIGPYSLCTPCARKMNEIVERNIVSVRKELIEALDKIIEK